ncbi:MAG: PEP/pyruvate-binding domain-containing protein [Bacteroidales bacterium]|jgi:pyruvate,orthophosphate dikinase|nr:PEP/pyruvate-binding domain-containing protein [Bacteroidales bacterium]
MIEMIKSKALEVNLQRTQNVPYSIPENHQLFISLSENYWGIHKRAEEFFNEFHHPFSNRKEIVKLMVHVLNSDFWIYKEMNKLEFVIESILDIFNQLFKEQLPDEISKQLLFNFLNFIDTQFDSVIKYDHFPDQIMQMLEDHFENHRFSYFVNIGYFKKKLSKLAQYPKTEQRCFDFMSHLVLNHIDFWKSTSQIEKWYEDNRSKMSKDYAPTIAQLGLQMYGYYLDKVQKADAWATLCESSFTVSEVIDALKERIAVFEKASEQFLYIFYLLHLPGTIYHREYILIELNKIIKKISTELNEKETIASIDALFLQFKEFKSTYLNMILDSILTLGKEIINTKNVHLIHYFENQVIQFGFVNPGITYMTNDWELKVNPCHIKNIRVWLALIEYSPETMKRLLSALIINLRIGGIFIFDTDFFQKDISKLLNSNISPIFKQIKQLAGIFPVYFNEIGAEGLLRDVSTKLDEITHRSDILIHFLRKQIHTEGNNSHIQIIVDIMRFWFDLNKDWISKVVPQNVFDRIDVDGIFVKGVHDLLVKTCDINHCSLEELIEKNKQEVHEMVSKVDHESAIDVERVKLIIELYQLLKEKYIFTSTDITLILNRYTFIAKEDIDVLGQLIKKKNDVKTLKHIYFMMNKLSDIIFDPNVSEGMENVFYKRHIAFGIPSMYGYYKEPKFDALGLTFRLEMIAAHYLRRIISEINVEYFTIKTIKEIHDVIQLIQEGLRRDGILFKSFNSNLKMLQFSLTSGCFTLPQYINIFQFMEANVKEITNTFFIHPYEQLLPTIISQHLTDEQKTDKNKLTKLIAQRSEVFYRETISASFIMQQLDHFIGDILTNLRKQMNCLTEEEAKNIMTYDQELTISPLYAKTQNIDNQVFLGNKAYYLKILYLDGYPVPPGFVITTEIFRRIDEILKVDSLNQGIDRMVKAHLHQLELMTGKQFGNSSNPLLISVRSGSAISMPGAMNTFLNVGLNDQITEELSKIDNFGWTSWDCYRRLIQTWGMSYGLERDQFDQIIVNYKKKYQVTQKIEFTPSVMREIAFEYKKLLSKNDIYFEEDPFKQLKNAIISVFNSWNTPRAKAYRNHMHIADEWGTAVTIQKMVLGNLHNESGSGVVFTRDEQDTDDTINLTGDFSFLSQGEDIVGGLVKTLPISEKQRIKGGYKSPVSLEGSFPKIYNKLYEVAKKMIEVNGFSHQEIEFTFETAEPEDLYILQSRNMSLHFKNRIEIFDLPEKKMKKVSTGIGIGSKALNGVIVFDLNDIAQIKNQNPSVKTVLVRPDTVPDDIEIIFECDGLVTERGGATSHAAVTAGTLGKTCVLNCNDMVVYEQEKKCTINGVIFNLFDPIAIDGKNGIIYKGNYPTKTEEF